MKQHPLLLTALPALIIAAPTMAQTAQLLNGTALVAKVPAQLWSVEGPIWNLDVNAQGIGVMGRVVTVPSSIDGVPFGMAGTEIVDSHGENLGMISAAEFDRLMDFNALVRDTVGGLACDVCGPLRLGPVRSIYSSSEARSPSVGGTDRLPAIQAMIEDNYFNMGISLYARYMDVLPVSWLGKIGVRSAQGTYPTSPFQLPPRESWTYPTTSGATLKAAGPVYVDQAGNEYLIPFAVDGFVIEFAENVVAGPVRAVRRGDESTPDSFLIGDMMITMNPDPRLELAFTGVGGAPITQDTMFQILESGKVPGITVGGYQVGEHMLFATAIEGENLYHPSMGIVVTADRFDVRVDRGEMRFRGVLAPSDGYTLTAEVGGAVQEVPLTPAVDFPGSVYDVRLEGLNLKGLTTLDLVVRNGKGVELHRQTFDFTEGIRD